MGSFPKWEKKKKKHLQGETSSEVLIVHENKKIYT